MASAFRHTEKGKEAAVREFEQRIAMQPNLNHRIVESIYSSGYKCYYVITEPTGWLSRIENRIEEYNAETKQINKG